MPRVLLAVLLALPAVCAAQADAPLARPEVRVGDRWTYRLLDAVTKKQRAQYELRVTFADDRAIHIVGVQRKDQDYDSIWTPEWNVVASGRFSVFSPHSGLLKFPLSTGSAYQSTFELAEARRGPAARIGHARTVRVAGWEEVAVPAGKFRALRVESEGVFQRLDSPRRGTSREVVWYVPAVKRWVKQTYEWKNDEGRAEATMEELVEFSVQ